MQAFIYGLLLAAVSATTVVAFKHPNGFARLFPYLLGAATVLFACTVLWQLAIEITRSRLDQYFAAISLPDAELVKAQLSLPYVWIALWYVVAVAFLWINLKLPAFLRVSDDNDAIGEQEEPH